jgi:hypothetical protein
MNQAVFCVSLLEVRILLATGQDCMACADTVKQRHKINADISNSPSFEPMIAVASGGTQYATQGHKHVIKIFFNKSIFVQ